MFSLVLFHFHFQIHKSVHLQLKSSFFFNFSQVCVCVLFDRLLLLFQLFQKTKLQDKQSLVCLVSAPPFMMIIDVVKVIFFFFFVSIDSIHHTITIDMMMREKSVCFCDRYIDCFFFVFPCTSSLSIIKCYSISMMIVSAVCLEQIFQFVVVGTIKFVVVVRET